MTDRSTYQRAYYARTRETRKRQRKERPAASGAAAPKPIIGIDGEGLSIDGRHYYSYLAAWSVTEEVGTIDADWSRGARQLTTTECLDFVLSLPANALIFGFSLGYDYTKWLEGLPDEVLYPLLHSELRRGADGRPYPMRWGNYRLQLVQGQLRVERIAPGEHRIGCRPWHRRACVDVKCRACRITPCTGCKTQTARTVWDIWKFFQGSFLNATESWGVLDKADKEHLARMKAARGNFTRDGWDDVKRYCGVECQRLAELGTRLLQAHRDAEIGLKQYFGAGSTGHAMLDAMGAREYMARRIGRKWVPVSSEYPAELLDAIACAFFGGRFELSMVGTIERKVWSHDIASAYPYRFTFLPCLVHGKWERVKGASLQRAIETSTTALVRYRLPKCDAVRIDKRKRPFYENQTTEYNSSPEPWGPFPFRTKEGLLVFPVTSGGGWVWRDEFLAGQRHFPNVEAVEAWVYRTECSCPVFRERMPAYYRERLRWGKEGKGIVLKLGANSCPGKCAQSKGSNPPFQNFVWAGMVNAGTRGQLTDAIACASDRANIIATATDGILSLEPLDLPKPRDTGTADAAREFGKGMLGQWEHDPEKNVYDGMHLIRPGVLFPLELGADVKQFRARGVGKQILRDERERILREYRDNGPVPFTVHRSMFWGMRSSVREGKRDAKYGTWTEAQPVQVSYLATPKRPLVEEQRLYTWSFSSRMTSEPYGPALGHRAAVPPHVAGLIAEKDFALDQPDIDDDLPDEREL